MNTAAPCFSPQPIAERLQGAWTAAMRVPAADIAVADEAQAYAVQDALIARLGPVGGWKVGAPSDTGAPQCAPLPASVVVASGSHLRRGAQSLRGIELEVAVRLRADLLPGDRLLSRAELAPAIDALLPAIELVDTRLLEGRDAPAPAKLADLQSHGALVLGAPSALDPLSLQMPGLAARLWFDDRPVADTVGGPPAPDIWRLLAWLARHAQARGLPLRAGQVVTTGTCTGLLFAPEGTRVAGEVAGIGRVELRLD